MFTELILITNCQKIHMTHEREDYEEQLRHGDILSASSSWTFVYASAKAYAVSAVSIPSSEKLRTNTPSYKY